MNRQPLAKLTVPQLRAECKRRDLPAYQHRGKRLRKPDLVRQLTDSRKEHDRCQSASFVDKTISAEAPTAFVVRAPKRTHAKTRMTIPSPELIQYLAQAKHAAALNVSMTEIADIDRLTMRRLMTRTGTGHDDQHWRLREHFTELVRVGAAS